MYHREDSIPTGREQILVEILYTYGFVIQIPPLYAQTYQNWIPTIVDYLAKDKESLKWVDGKLQVPTSTAKPSNPIWERVMSLLRKTAEEPLKGGSYSAMYLFKP